MVRQAMRRYPTALDRSYMVGDKIDDILLARNAGMARGFLVCTGNGRKSVKEKKVLRSTSSRVVHHIGQAARCILSQKEPK
jgi:histidinol phosphatase-like enzyme